MFKLAGIATIMQRDACLRLLEVVLFKIYIYSDRIFNRIYSMEIITGKTLCFENNKTSVSQILSSLITLNNRKSSIKFGPHLEEHDSEHCSNSLISI